MLKDNWEDKHGINLPAHISCSDNMALQSLQGVSNSVSTLTSPGSNLQDGRFGLPISQPTSIEPDSFKHQFHQQGQSLVDSNLQKLITFLSANYGPEKTPLEMGTPEYLKLVEILKQSSDNSRASSVEESSGGPKDGGTNNIFQNVVKSSNNQEKISCCEQLWEGSLQLSSSVTLSAVAFFKSGEKLVGNHWPEFIEVKGKVKLEAFEKYVQGLPRSRNRGLMVTSICWNEESSNIGLNGMKEVAKGYKKSSKVGFAQLTSGIDLYICPRSDPIITILAKYGFFKGLSVIDDKPDSMIGCVVWRKNRLLNPVENTSDSPPGFSSKQRTDQKLSPEKTESSQRDEPLTLPLTIACAEVEVNKGSSSSSAEVDTCNLVVKKRPFEDDDLPEFDFGIACGKSKFDSGVVCGKSIVASKPLNSPKKLDNNSSLIQLPSVMHVIERSNNNNNNGSLKPSLKKTKLFDDDDMPEWLPPELHNQLPPHITTTNIQKLPLYPPHPPPLPPLPPPPRADIRSPFSYLPFRPPVNSQPPVFVRPPPQPLPPPPPPRPPQLPSLSGRFGSNQVLWHQQPFPASVGRRPQL